MEHISLPIARVAGRALLCKDVRLATLFSPDHRVRQPALRVFHGFVENAEADINIDHSALLDGVWKLRTSQGLMQVLAGRTECERTKEALLNAAALMDDNIADMELLLARKAEAELWLENIG